MNLEPAVTYERTHETRTLIVGQKISGNEAY